VSPTTRIVSLGIALSLVWSMSAVSQTASGIPFMPEGIDSIKGRDVCNFRGEFLNRFGVYLDGAKEFSVDYMELNGVLAVFLLSKPILKCGTVDAALDLTHLAQKGETVEFKCYTSHEGGTTLEKWGHVVGLANNHRGTQRFVKARLAWRVNIEEKRFELLDGQPVTCDTSGYVN
jgi:hypothetical protein